MKALVLEEYKQFAYRDAPDPLPGPGEVLIQVGACGICGSDVHGMDGSTGRRIPPIIMGHEAAGAIVGLGPDVTGWAEGDRVTFDSTIYCGHCWYCRRGLINLCEDRRVLGVSTPEYRQQGAFADLVVVPERVLYRLPEGLSFAPAAMVEALSVAFHAATRVPPALNDTAVVVGAGMIGQFIVQVLRHAGCRQVIAVDLDQTRLELACRLGATQGLRSDVDDVPRAVLAATEGRGADVAFEAVGVANSLKLAVAVLRKGGSLALVGNLAQAAELPLQAVVTRELSLIASCASRLEYPACLDLIARGVVKVEPLISAVAPLAEGAEWFARLYRREPGLMKVILTPDGGEVPA